MSIRDSIEYLAKFGGHVTASIFRPEGELAAEVDAIAERVPQAWCMYPDTVEALEKGRGYFSIHVEHPGGIVALSFHDLPQPSGWSESNDVAARAAHYEEAGRLAMETRHE